MGWNSWNSFANIVNSQIVQEQAKALASNGMKEAGYEYVVIDEGWWLGERDAAGNIAVNPKQWPAIQPGQKDGDMANIAAYIHSLGLKAGIYTDAGRDGCSMYPDSGPLSQLDLFQPRRLNQPFADLCFEPARRCQSTDPAPRSEAVPVSKTTQP